MVKRLFHALGGQVHLGPAEHSPHGVGVHDLRPVPRVVHVGRGVGLRRLLDDRLFTHRVVLEFGHDP